MKFICINNSRKEDELTIGKVYDVPDYIYYNKYLRPTLPIINNLGEIFNYVNARFITLDEWRLQRINKIINE